MSAQRPRTSRGRAAARVGSGASSTALFILGALFDALAVINVPGAATLPSVALPAAHAPSPVITTPGVLLFLLEIAAWATVFLRRRAPLVVLITGGVLLVIGFSYALFLVGVFYTLLSRREWRRRIVLIAVVSIGLFAVREVFTPWGNALAWLFDPARGGSNALPWNIATIAVALACQALVGGMAAYARTRGEADSNHARAEREHRRADALDEQLARQAERERIAGDIHDALSHRLSVISLQAGALEVEASSDARLTERARVLRAHTHASLEDLRSLLGGLRMDPSAQAGPSRSSMKAIGALLRDLRQTGVRIEAYVLIDDAERATALLDSAVYRIVQESLTNAIKHAPGMPLSVYVEASAASGVRVRVSNPLGAADAQLPGAGQGVVGIRHRAEALGGTAWIGRSEGSYLVDVSLPWSERG